MFVKCLNCGLQTLARDFCDHCRHRLPTETRPAPAPLPPDNVEEDIPVVLPVASVSPAAPALAELPAVPSQRVFARRAEAAPPRRAWPWILGAAGGVILFGCLAVGVAEMVARSTGTSLFGNRPAPTAPNVATIKDPEADKLVLKKAKAPPLSPDTIEEMLKLVEAQREDTLFDLGCGNGLLAVQAAEKGLFVFAYDSDPLLVKMARRLLTDRPHINLNTIKIEQKDNVFEADLRRADIIVIAHPERWGGSHEVGKQLKPRLGNLKEGARLISTQPIFSATQRSFKEKFFEPPDDPGRKYQFFVYKAPFLEEGR
jgi:precorrin-6B methylase 2